MSRLKTTLLAATAALLGASLLRPWTALAESAPSLPAPLVDVAPSSGLQTAVLSGGCFWGIQGVFEHVKGVRQVFAGYSGGHAKPDDLAPSDAGRDHACCDHTAVLASGGLFDKSPNPRL